MEIGTSSRVKSFLKRGTLNHVKGFIMNKLFEKGCLGTIGSHHAKQMPARDLRTGYDSKYHKLFDRAVGELRAEGLILVFPARTGRGSEDHAVANKGRLLNARGLINAYRDSVGLKRLRRDLREFE